MTKHKRGSNVSIEEKAIKYAEIVARKVAKENKIRKCDHQDLINDAIAEALSQLKSYNPEKSALNTFIQKAVVGHLMDCLKHYGTIQGDSDDNTTCCIYSLEDQYDNDADENLDWEETVADTEAEEQEAYNETLDELEELLALLSAEKGEMIKVRFRFKGITETKEHYIRRKRLTLTTFYRMTDDIITELKKQMNR